MKVTWGGERGMRKAGGVKGGVCSVVRAWY